MAEYKSDKVTLRGSAHEVYARLSNLENLRDLIAKAPVDKLPEDKLRQLQSLEITPDSITVPGGPMGAVTLNVTRRVEPELIELKADRLPIDVSLSLRISPVSESSCEAQAVIDAAIPAMLKPMVSGPIKQMLGQVSGLLSSVNFA